MYEFVILGSGQSDSRQEPKSCSTFSDRSMALDRGRQSRLGCGGRDEAGRTLVRGELMRAAALLSVR